MVSKNSNDVAEYCCLMAKHFLSLISLQIVNMANMAHALSYDVTCLHK